MILCICNSYIYRDSVWCWWIKAFLCWGLWTIFKVKASVDRGRIERFEDKLCGNCLYRITNSYIFIPIYLFGNTKIFVEKPKILSKTWLHLKSNFTGSNKAQAVDFTPQWKKIYHCLRAYTTQMTFYTSMAYKRGFLYRPQPWQFI